MNEMKNKKDSNAAARIVDIDTTLSIFGSHNNGQLKSVRIILDFGPVEGINVCPLTAMVREHSLFMY